MDHAQHDHAGHDVGGIDRMALSATLHCLSGCAIGEVLGLMIGTAIGLTAGWTIVLAVGLAFFFGYTLSTFPLVKTGLGLGAALGIVLAADTLSILTMEIVDNLVMAFIPGAMDAGLVNPTFWIGMTVALAVAALAAYPSWTQLTMGQRVNGGILTLVLNHEDSTITWSGPGTLQIETGGARHPLLPEQTLSLQLRTGATTL